jgi:hypothetical protein
MVGARAVATVVDATPAQVTFTLAHAGSPGPNLRSPPTGWHYAYGVFGLFRMGSLSMRERL